ncbi:MAG: response regulator [Candidatus Latescibacteria bacterium]|nr:response regulator [Candidatus Latescibacterota bacterium]
MTDTIRIVLADDHPVVREGLAAILSTQADFEVVGQAGDGRQAIELIDQVQPDVVLLDLEMPHLDGVETLQALQAAGSDTRIIVFTVFDTDERILGAVQAGARGYLLKGAPRAEIFNAVRIVHQGGSLLQPLVASKLLDQVNERNSTQALTQRENEVLQLLSKGLQNKEIADVLSISERTAKFHVSALLRKLEAGNRTEAVALAAQKGLVQV